LRKAIISVFICDRLSVRPDGTNLFGLMWLLYILGNFLKQEV